MKRFPSETFVFTGVEGGALRQTWKRRVYLPAVRTTGLALLRFHDLRHTSVALAIQAGAHPKVVQERAGHKAALQTTLLDIYGHLFPNLDEGVTAALDLVARRAASSPPAGSLVPIGETA